MVARLLILCACLYVISSVNAACTGVYRGETASCPIRIGVDNDITTAQMSEFQTYFDTYASQVPPLYIEVTTNNTIYDLANYHADVIDVDASMAFLAWQRFHAKVLAAEKTHSTGGTRYVLSALVREDSNLNSFEALQGARSCHSSALSDSFFVPLVWGLQQGVLQADNNITGTIDTCNSPAINLARNYFSEACAVANDMSSVGICDLCPNDDCNMANIYAGDLGALRGLSVGVCEVAFIRKWSWEYYCNLDDSSASSAGTSSFDWCLPTTELREISDFILNEGFGSIPSRAYMIRNHSNASQYNQTWPLAVVTQLHAALVGLSEEPQLLSYQRKSGIDPVIFSTGADFNTEQATMDHLGDFGPQLEILPGLSEFIALGDACIETQSCAPADASDDETGGGVYQNDCENASQLGSSALTPIKFGIPPGLDENALAIYRNYFEKVYILNGLYITEVEMNSMDDLYKHRVDIIASEAGEGLIGYLRYNMRLLARERTSSDTRPYQHTATALINILSEAETFEDLEGTRVCQGGFFAASGSLVPVSWAITNGRIAGLYNQSHAVDSCHSPLDATLRAFFSAGCAPPHDDGQVGLCDLCPSSTSCGVASSYYGDVGALRGLSDGACTVAFVRTTTYEETCAQSDDSEDWCVKETRFMTLAELDEQEGFGTLPSDGFWIRSGGISVVNLYKLQAALAAINNDPAMLALVGWNEVAPVDGWLSEETFNALYVDASYAEQEDSLQEILTTATSTHLSDLSNTVADLPGFDVFTSCFDNTGDAAICGTLTPAGCDNLDEAAHENDIILKTPDVSINSAYSLHHQRRVCDMPYMITLLIVMSVFLL